MFGNVSSLAHEAAVRDLTLILTMRSLVELDYFDQGPSVEYRSIHLTRYPTQPMLLR